METPTCLELRDIKKDICKSLMCCVRCGALERNKLGTWRLTAWTDLSRFLLEDYWSYPEVYSTVGKVVPSSREATCSRCSFRPGLRAITLWRSIQYSGYSSMNCISRHLHPLEFSHGETTQHFLGGHRIVSRLVTILEQKNDTCVVKETLELRTSNTTGRAEWMRQSSGV